MNTTLSPEKQHVQDFDRMIQEQFTYPIQEDIMDMSEELGVSYQCAADIYYLRTRSRWTEELENELIRLHKQGNPPNMNEFGT